MTDETSHLHVAIAKSGTEVLVEVGGAMDLSTTDALRAHLDGLIDTRTEDVALDLSAVSFCDSTALHALLDTRERLNGLGRRLRVVRPSRAVDRVLWLSGLAEMFYIPAPVRER